MLARDWLLLRYSNTTLFPEIGEEDELFDAVLSFLGDESSSGESFTSL
jgi:hypothetical protein